jgi:Spy/CpxP family protein refolding chaperone
MNKFSKAIIVLAIIGIVGYAATSFAGWGRGGGNCYGQGSGWAQRGSGPAGYQGNLSDDQIDKLNNERQAFFEGTRELRENLYQKELELRSELAKKDPDAKKAVSLQKEVSELQGQLGQKRVEHRIKMQKENPEIFAGQSYGQGRGYGQGQGYGKGGRGMRRGYGMGQGYGMGRGFQGQGGGCWN